MVKFFDSSENYELRFDNAELLDAPAADTEQGTQQPDNSGATDPEPTFFSKYGTFILLGVLLVLIVVGFVFSGRKNKQRQKEYTEQLAAIAPGNKVKTAGGICGIVVEVCDDNTVIMETGSETSGKSYIKMDKELIAQTDAKGPTQIARERAEAERRAEKEKKAAPAPTAEPAQEQPAPEATDETPSETPEEK